MLEHYRTREQECGPTACSRQVVTDVEEEYCVVKGKGRGHRFIDLQHRGRAPQPHTGWHQVRMSGELGWRG